MTLESPEQQLPLLQDLGYHWGEMRNLSSRLRLWGQLTLSPSPRHTHPGASPFCMLTIFPRGHAALCVPALKPGPAASVCDFECGFVVFKTLLWFLKLTFRNVAFP